MLALLMDNIFLINLYDLYFNFNSYTFLVSQPPLLSLAGIQAPDSHSLSPQADALPCELSRLDDL